MRRLLCLALLLGAFAGSDPALAQRVTPVRPASPPPRVTPMPRPAVPSVEPASPAPEYSPPQDVYSVPQSPAYSVQQDGGDAGDSDSDGFSNSDCDDLNAAVHPGATDPPGGRDMDCDGDPNG